MKLEIKYREGPGIDACPSLVRLKFRNPFLFAASPARLQGLVDHPLTI